MNTLSDLGRDAYHAAEAALGPAGPWLADLAGHHDVLGILRTVWDGLRHQLAGKATAPVDLTHLAVADRQRLDAVLGQGEAVVQIAADAARADAGSLRAQESVFAGVWWVCRWHGDERVQDALELGAFPHTATWLAGQGRHTWIDLPPALAAGAPRAAALLQALRDCSVRFTSARDAGGTLPAPHVVNLSLLPLSPEEHEVLWRTLGAGGVTVLARGFGNCRVASTQVAHVWRVSYFNVQDRLILDTLEVAEVPEVACAKRQDLAHSAERLEEVLRWAASA